MRVDHEDDDGMMRGSVNERRFFSANSIKHLGKKQQQNTCVCACSCWDYIDQSISLFVAKLAEMQLPSYRRILQQQQQRKEKKNKPVGQRLTQAWSENTTSQRDVVPGKWHVIITSTRNRRAAPSFFFFFFFFRSFFFFFFCCCVGLPLSTAVCEVESDYTFVERRLRDRWGVQDCRKT